MNNTKIPKVINYCWFGGNKKNKVAEKCIQSWEKIALIMNSLNGMKIILMLI